MFGRADTTRWFDGPDNDQPSLFWRSLVGYEEGKWPTLSRREQALALLRLADLDIEDVVIDEQEVVFSGSGETRPNVDYVLSTGPATTPRRSTSRPSRRGRGHGSG